MADVDDKFVNYESYPDLLTYKIIGAAADILGKNSRMLDGLHFIQGDISSSVLSVFFTDNCPVISYWNPCIWLAESKFVSEKHWQNAWWNAPLIEVPNACNFSLHKDQGGGGAFHKTFVAAKTCRWATKLDSSDKFLCSDKKNPFHNT